MDDHVHAQKLLLLELDEHRRTLIQALLTLQDKASDYPEVTSFITEELDHQEEQLNLSTEKALQLHGTHPRLTLVPKKP